MADTATRKAERTVGPFANSIRPFTVNGRQTRCYVCVNELLGFEVGDLTTGKKLYQVEVPGFSKGAVKRHGCPSHGIALTPDETEIRVTDAYNQRMHIFDATSQPPRYKSNVSLRDEPGWITFSLRGDFVYPSTGEVIDPAAKRIVRVLTDENGVAVQSEKMVQVDLDADGTVHAGDQFGIGRVRP